MIMFMQLATGSTLLSFSDQPVLG